MKNFYAFLFVLLLAFVSTNATAQTALEAEAYESLFAQGMHAFDDEQFEVAMKKWEAAFQFVKNPVALYNISSCHLRLGDFDEASRVVRDVLTMDLDPIMQAKGESRQHALNLKSKLEVVTTPEEKIVEDKIVEDKITISDPGIDVVKTGEPDSGLSTSQSLAIVSAILTATAITSIFYFESRVAKNEEQLNSARSEQEFDETKETLLRNQTLGRVGIGAAIAFGGLTAVLFTVKF